MSPLFCLRVREFIYMRKKHNFYFFKEFSALENLSFLFIEKKKNISKNILVHKFLKNCFLRSVFYPCQCLF